MRNFVTALVGAAVLLSALPAVASPIQGRSLPQVEKAYPNESYAQYYYRRGYLPAPITAIGIITAVTMARPSRPALPGLRPAP